jgi:hypothetical protein
MARQNLNTGSTANDGTGDTLRTAGTKINENFIELYSQLGGGDSGTSLTTAVRLVDSGLEYVGVTNNSILTHTEGASKLIFTLPDSAGTVTINTATQTLTNKTLDSATLNNPILDGIVINDTNASHTYNIKPGNLTSKNININLPVLADSDTLTFNAQTQTLTNKTLTSPKIGTAIQDVNGAELLKVTATASAANELTLANAAAGNRPTISATGTDTNVGINIENKGTGVTRLGKIAYASAQMDSSGDRDMEKNTFIVLNPTSAQNFIIRDGSVSGELKIILNRGTATATLEADSGAGALMAAGNVRLAPNAMSQFIYESVENKWHMIGTDSAGNGIAIV